MPPTPLNINPELQNFLSPLSPKQYAKLEAEILSDGCTSPLTVWDTTIVDGHNRYEICTKHGIKFQITHKTFDTLDDAKYWMWQRQDGQRNLTRFQRVEVALKMKEIVAAQTKYKQISKLKQNAVPHNCAERTAPKETRQILAKFANVSHATVDRVEFILKYGDEKTINLLRWEEKETSINREYTRIKAEQDAKFPPKPKKPKKQTAQKTENSAKTTSEKQNTTASKPVEEKPERTESAEEKPKSSAQKNETKTSSQTGRFCRDGEKPGDTGEPYVSRSSLTDLPHDQPEILVAQLIAHFPRPYVRECPFLILEALLANDGSETTNLIIQKIVDELLHK